MLDMEEAYRTVRKTGEKPGVSKARILLNEDYNKFVTLYAKLAGTGTQTTLAAAATTVEAKVGEKEEGVEELAERLLVEWEGESSGPATSSVPGRDGVGGEGEERSGAGES